MELSPSAGMIPSFSPDEDMGEIRGHLVEAIAATSYSVWDDWISGEFPEREFIQISLVVNLPLKGYRPAASRRDLTDPIHCDTVGDRKNQMT